MIGGVRWPPKILTRGPVVDRLEEAFASWLGVERENVVAVSSGTTGLEAILLALRTDWAGRKVVCPAWSFISTASALVRVGAVPVFVDCRRDGTICPDAVKLAMTTEVCAIVATDVDGVVVDQAVQAIAEVHGVPLIEDAAAAYGGWNSAGTQAGLVGTAAMFSLSDSKLLAAGEGGLVVASTRRLADELRAVIRYGERGNSPDGLGLRYASVVGMNGKMTELVAEVALDQIVSGALNERISMGKANAWLLDKKLGRARRCASRKSGVHKYRAWINRSYLDSMERAGVPLMRENVDILTRHPAFSRYSFSRPRDNAHSEPPAVADVSMANDILARTICLGSRSAPIWTWTEPEARTVAGWLARNTEPSEVS